MRNIIVVQCMSTGINYIQDIIDRNHNPIVLDFEHESYEEKLAMVKDYDPLLISIGMMIAMEPRSNLFFYFFPLFLYQYSDRATEIFFCIINF